MENFRTKSVIIVAGGTGQRLGSAVPKQFLLLSGKPVLMHTIENFFRSVPQIKIILVLPFEHIELWNRLISEYRFLIAHQLVAGGKTRFDSVKNGLATLNDEGLVAIHDGVRPLVSKELIIRGYDLADKYSGSIPVISPSESLRKVVNGTSISLDREAYRLVQTPQTFDTGLIKKAYTQPYEDTFTDDAFVFENDGNSLVVFDGDRENIKITWSVDIDFAEAVLQRRTSERKDLENKK